MLTSVGADVWIEEEKEEPLQLEAFSGMLPCKSCAHPIHETALACPKCGASTTTSFAGFWIFATIVATLVAMGIYGSEFDDGGLYAIAGFVITYLVLFGYCFPILLAQKRGHPQFWPIAILTIAGGWLVIFWFAALVWAAYTPNQNQKS